MIVQYDVNAWFQVCMLGKTLMFCATYYKYIHTMYIHVRMYHAMYIIMYFNRYLKHNVSLSSLRVLPHHQDTGGFFIAVLHKSNWLPWQRKPRSEAAVRESSSSTCVEQAELSPKPDILTTHTGTEEKGVAGDVEQMRYQGTGEETNGAVVRSCEQMACKFEEEKGANLADNEDSLVQVAASDKEEVQIGCVVEEEERSSECEYGKDHTQYESVATALDTQQKTATALDTQQESTGAALDTQQESTGAALDTQQESTAVGQQEGHVSGIDLHQGGEAMELGTQQKGITTGLETHQEGAGIATGLTMGGEEEAGGHFSGDGRPSAAIWSRCRVSVL